MSILKDYSKIKVLISILIIGIFFYLPQLLTIVIISKDFSNNLWVLPSLGIIGSIIRLIFRLVLILSILFILLKILNKLDGKSFKTFTLSSPMIFSPFIVFGTIGFTLRLVNYYFFPEVIGLRKGFEFYGAIIAWIISFIIYGHMLNEKLENKKISGAITGVTCVLVFLLIPPTI